MRNFIFIFTIFVFSPLHLFAQDQVIDTSLYYPGETNYNFLIAAEKGYTSEVERFLKNGAEINTSVQEGITALMYATQNNHVNVVKLLMEKGADLNNHNDFGETALIIAVKNNNPDIAEILILGNSDIDLSDYEKVTPLMHAIANGNYLLTDMLLYYGADFDKKDKSGMDALMLSSFLGFIDIDSLLIESGANIQSFDNSGFSPLHMTVQNGFIDVVKLLIDNGADINAQNNYGYSPLAIAVELNDMEMSKFLIENGADVNQKITLTLSLLDLAKANRYDSLKLILRKQKARPSPLPVFNKFTIGTPIDFNADDFLMGLSAGFSDKKYNIDLFAEYKFRPFATRVLEQSDENIYYQYWERRAMFSAGVDKRIKLINQVTSSFGLVAGIKESFTFGSYKGVETKPLVAYLFVPSAGFYFTNDWFKVKLVYEYMNLDLYTFQKGWIGFSTTFLFNRKQNVFHPKDISWF